MKILFNGKIYETKINKYGHVVSSCGRYLFAMGEGEPLLFGEEVLDEVIHEDPV